MRSEFGTKNASENPGTGTEVFLDEIFEDEFVMKGFRNYMELMYAKFLFAEKNRFLEMEVKKSHKEVSMTQEAFITAITALAKTRDNETGNHILRTKLYVEELAAQLCREKIYLDVLTSENVGLIARSAPLHDIGKVGIPDYILLKPGKLTEEEFEILKTHTTLGMRVIVSAENSMDMPATFLRFVKEIVYSHHERWDGKGYPEGLSGEAIPVSARLMALADVYDAISSRRVYKEALTHSAAVDLILQESGKQFDPLVVDCFLKVHGRFKYFAERYTDKDMMGDRTPYGIFDKK